MDEELRRLCKEHDLSGIGVNVFDAKGRAYIGIYVHWLETDGSRCASGMANTFNDALARALSEMAAYRCRPASPAFPMPEFYDFEDRSGEAA